MDTIRELFYGNIHPYEREIPKDSECDKLIKWSPLKPPL